MGSLANPCPQLRCAICSNLITSIAKKFFKLQRHGMLCFCGQRCLRLWNRYGKVEEILSKISSKDFKCPSKERKKSQQEKDREAANYMLNKKLKNLVRQSGKNIFKNPFKYSSGH